MLQERRPMPVPQGGSVTPPAEPPQSPPPPPPTADPVTPTEPEPSPPPPEPPKYEPSVIRRLGMTATNLVAGFEVVVPKAGGWFDTGIPLVAKDEGNVEAEEAENGGLQYWVKLSTREQIFVPRQVGFVHHHYVSMILDGNYDQTLNETPTILIKIVDEVPVAKFRVLLVDNMNLVDYMGVPNFQARRAEAVTRRDELIRKLATDDK